MACGEVGLAIAYFYGLTPREFDNILEGYRRRETALFRNNWEQTRQMMWAALAPHQNTGSGLTPEKLLRFPWEAPAEAVQAAELEKIIAQVEQNKAFWDKVDAKKIRA